MNLFYKIYPLFLLVASIFFISCDSKNDSVTEKSGAPVQITHPLKKDLTEYITLNAQTVFLKKEIVRATFQGFIEKIYKNIGDNVSSGDVLFEIKTKEFAADHNLQVPLGDEIFKGIIQIKAQSNGVLTELDYHTGDFVSDGEQIAVISNPSSLRIYLDVPYQYTSEVRINTPCKIFLPDSKTVNAFVDRIIPIVEPTAQTQTYVLKMKGVKNIPENLNVNARIPIHSVKNAIVVPQNAVQANETLDKFWIMKLINDSTAVRIDIIKGIENDSLIQIIKPELKITDRLISEGAFGLPDTAKIEIVKK